MPFYPVKCQFKLGDRVVTVTFKKTVWSIHQIKPTIMLADASKSCIETRQLCHYTLSKQIDGVTTYLDNMPEGSMQLAPEPVCTPAIAGWDEI